MEKPSLSASPVKVVVELTVPTLERGCPEDTRLREAGFSPVRIYARAGENGGASIIGSLDAAHLNCDTPGDWAKHHADDLVASIRPAKDRETAPRFGADLSNSR